MTDIFYRQPIKPATSTVKPLRENTLHRDRIAYTVRKNVTIATSKVGKGFLTEVAIWYGREHWSTWTVVAAAESHAKARIAHARVVAAYRAPKALTRVGGCMMCGKEVEYPDFTDLCNNCESANLKWAWENEQ